MSEKKHNEKLSVSFNKLGVILPFALLSIGLVMFFVPLNIIALKFYGFIFIFAGVVSLFALSVSYIQAKAVAAYIENTRESNEDKIEVASSKGEEVEQN